MLSKVRKGRRASDGHSGKLLPMISKPNQTSSVEAVLNYVTQRRERPYMYTFEPPDGQPSSNIGLDPWTCSIENGRPDVHSFSLEETGFALLHERSAVKDFYDPDQVNRVYYPEAERLLMAATGALRAVVFDHTLRKHVCGAVDRRHTYRQPVQLVHVDYSDQSGPRRVRNLYLDHENSALRSRVQIVNLWRSMRNSLRDAPLAVCDARSVAASDFVRADLVYPTGPSEVFLFAHNPSHRWYFFPEMDAAEVLIFKCYDSMQNGCTRFTPHTSFVDPAMPSESSPRESIELRVLLIYP